MSRLDIKLRGKYRSYIDGVDMTFETLPGFLRTWYASRLDQLRLKGQEDAVWVFFPLGTVATWKKDGEDIRVVELTEELLKKLLTKLEPMVNSDIEYHGLRVMFDIQEDRPVFRLLDRNMLGSLRGAGLLGV